MTLEIPDSPKVYTTRYAEFRGVDYTNDPTNVWKRRSPSGVNMLPDASGRPFKRNGWETVITADKLLEALKNGGVDIDETQVYRCFYFELGGNDHIVIFCEGGVFIYTQGELTLLSGSDDADCYSSYDRAFFFEGGGMSAFYIYGNFKIWRYSVDGFDRVEADIPTVMISATADGVGEVYNPYNMLSNKANIEYQNNDLFYYTTSGDMSISVAKETFVTQVSGTKGIYIFTYDTDHWELEETTVDITEYGIDVAMGTPSDEDFIRVIYSYGVILPINVTQAQIDDVKVYSSRVTQFDYEFDVLPELNGSTPNTPSGTEVVLHTDADSYRDRKAWIEFASSEMPIVDGEDTIRVTTPITEVIIDTYEEQVGGGQAEIDRG